MASPVSTAPAVKAFLLTLCQTAALSVPLAPGDNSKLGVSYAEPGTYTPDDIVCFGRVARDVTAHAFVGDGSAGSFAEEYTLEVIVHAFRAGDNGQMAEERAYAILAAVEQAVRADMTLGGLTWKAEPGSSELATTWDPDGPGYHAHLVAELRCSAVI